MSDEKFLIHELAERAGTTVRTIRYYTDEGLLPLPENQGKYAYYTPDHVNRLELIKRMKDTYLPLREIREIINSLSDPEVCQRLTQAGLPETNQKDKATQYTVETGSSALQYINRLMDEQAGHRVRETPNSNQAQAKVSRPRELYSTTNTPTRGSSPLPTGEAWLRIPLAPGIELHLREPGDPDAESRIQQLITFAQKLFR